MVSVAKQIHGTILVVAAAMTFALVALVVKKDPLPTVLATEARFFVSWVMSVGFMLKYRSEQGLKWFGPAKIRKALILRGILLYSFVTLWWTALTTAPLGDCIAVIYCDPLVTVLMSAVILGEKTLSVFPIQALLAVTGMLFIIQPPTVLTALGLTPTHNGDSGANANYTLVLLATLVSSSMYIVTNQTKEASWIEVEHVTNFLAVFILNPLLFCAQQLSKGDALLALPAAVPAWEVGLIVLAALGSFLGVAMQTQGYQLAEPGKAAMFTYAEIPFGYMLQHFGTGSVITSNSVVGAILVILACLLGAVAQVKGSFEGYDDIEKVPLKAKNLNLPLTMKDDDRLKGA